MTKATTSIANATIDDVFIRGRSLCSDLLGNVSFTEMAYFQITGRMPTAAQTAVVNACLVSLMEHGLTPSVLSTRLVYSSAPEAMQSAVAAGLLAVGSVFVGTVEGCAALLDTIVAQPASERAATAQRIAAEHRASKRPVPGFGHPHHKNGDPRTKRLFEVADESGIAGDRVAALRALSAAVDAIAGKPIVVNATGAVAALLGDAEVPARIMRGFALLARCAGLIGHVAEEQERPAMRAIWEAANAAVPYVWPEPTR